ncbi:MAG: hypothetical protein HY670_01520 [Chloroflexi bacterium]|nr:hypothetical protein [Chloroflexota bacterium]
MSKTKSQAKENRASNPREEKLMADLEKYRQMALAMGADDARIVPVSQIVQKLRARMVDQFPRAYSIGVAYFAEPSFEIPWKYAKAILAAYRYAIMAHVPYPMDNPNNFTGPTAAGELGQAIEIYKDNWTDEDIRYWREVVEKRQGRRHAQASVSNTIEREARKDGHQFAVGGLSGMCIQFCEQFGNTCIALKTGICRNPGKSRPFGTAATLGYDHPGTYTNLGWRNRVQGWSIFPEDYPEKLENPSPARTATVLIE